MAIVTIKLRNREFSLECTDEEKLQVEACANNLVSLFEKLNISSQGVSTEHILVLVAIILQTEKMPDLALFEAEKKQIIQLCDSLTEVKAISDNLIQKIV